MSLLTKHSCSGSVVGAGYPLPADKKNHDGRPVGGLYLIRTCEECGSIFSREGGTDMIGTHKVPVQNGSSVIFMDSCGKGCPPADLLVTYIERPGKDVDDFVLGCNFCGFLQNPLPLAEAIKSWDSRQRKIRQGTTIGNL